MKRITMKTLEYKCEEINARNGWSLKHPLGELCVYAAYGQYAIDRTTGNGSTGHRRMYGLATAKECYAFLCGFDYQ